MHSQVEALWWFGVMVAVVLFPMGLCLAVLWLPRANPKRKVMAGRLLSLMMLALLSALVLVLSGCGTAPLLAPTRLQVPAELLTPPAPPVLLTPGSALPPPGPITRPTPKPARPTGSGTSV